MLDGFRANRMGGGNNFFAGGICWTFVLEGWAGEKLEGGGFTRLELFFFVCHTFPGAVFKAKNNKNLWK